MTAHSSSSLSLLYLLPRFVHYSEASSEVGRDEGIQWKREILDRGDRCNQHLPCSSDLYGLELKFQKDSGEQWGHTERRYYDTWQHFAWRADGIEYRTKELDSRIEDLEGDANEVNYGDKIERLRNYARRIHCGLILMGGFTEPDTPDTATISAYDALQELNAGNFLARRSLEDMQASTEQYWGHKVMFKKATDGATPSEGPLSKIFNIGNREISMRGQYIAEQASQLRGRLEAKLGQLHEKYTERCLLL